MRHVHKSKQAKNLHKHIIAVTNEILYCSVSVLILFGVEF